MLFSLIFTILWRLFQNLHIMKKLLIISMMIFPFIMLSTAQEAAYSKASKTQSQIQEPEYEPVQENLFIDDFTTSSGGMTDCFYYGDPSGMYLNAEWEEGKAVLLDGQKLDGNFRYNLYKQKMEAIVEGDTFAFAKPCEIEVLKIGERKFIYSTFIRSDQEVANTWFEVLCEGEYCLLQRQYIKYRIADGDDDPTNDQLYRMQEYYTRNNDEKLMRFYASKKILLETLPEHQEEVKEYMKSERLKLNNPDDLVEVFAYYNMLASGY